MEINFFGKKTLASLIIVSIVNFIKFRFRQFNIDEMMLWKIYYELQKSLERSPLKKIATEEEFITLMTSSLKFFEEFFDEQIKKDPEFMDKLLKQNSYLWGVYKFISDFINNQNVLSPIAKEIKSQINKKIIETPELLDYKVKRDVDYAISDYEKKETKIKKEPDYIFTETLEGETPLGGEMRIQAKWMVNNDD